MRYSLDACTLVFLLYGDESVRDKLIEHETNNQILIPPMAYYEVLRGLLARNSVKKTAILKAMYQNSYALFQIHENDVFEKSAEIFVELKNKGFAVGSNDIVIAAWSILADSTLITDNTKDFENINELKFENWKNRP
jgi:predicted nucleic acid-binding protein